MSDAKSSPAKEEVVLLVEDNASDARLVQALLGRRGGFKVVHAERLAAGLERLADGGVDVVLLDLNLPDSRGLATLDTLRQRYPSVPVLVFTGADDESLGVEGLNKGAQDYLVKGQVNTDLLVRSIRYALARARGEAALRDSEERFRGLYENMLNGVAIYEAADNGQDFIITAINPAGERICRLQAPEVVGKRVSQVFPGIRDLGLPAVFQRVWRTGKAEQFGPALYRDARIRLWVENSVFRLPSGEMVAVFSDLTERRQAEEALLNGEQQLQAIFQAAPNMAFIVADSQGIEPKVQEFSPGAEQMFGFKREEALGQPVQRFNLPPQVWAPTGNGQDAHTGAYSGTAMLTRRSGEQFPALVSAHSLVDAHGGAGGTLVVCFDISEQKRLEAQLAQAQKMESVGRLAGGIAHDFNNLLSVTMGHAELALGKLPPDSPVCRDLELIRQAGERGAALTRQILAFARKQVIAPQVVNPNELILGMGKMLRRVIGEDIEFTTALRPDLHHTSIDPGQYEQVLLNLAVNARDAMPKGGRLTIETNNVFLDEHHGGRDIEIPPGMYVMTAVSDTGMGMDKKVMQHLFEPFFTTKERGRGTGLGLATCYGIAKQNRGFIWAYSEPGHGTVFKLYLPRAEAAPESGEVALQQPAAAKGTETVLVAEDETALRSLIVSTLRGQGYTVLEAAHGEEALRVANGHSGPLQLLLTDIIMPIMGGPELAERLTRERPGIRVLFTSGYTDDAIVQQGVLEKGVHLIEKPFSPLALARKVRQVLDEPARRNGAPRD